tara:strand:+ start:469 stop:726 length:258 start_codon:yes stop_codon:yes gene_type:complete
MFKTKSKQTALIEQAIETSQRNSILGYASSFCSMLNRQEDINMGIFLWHQHLRNAMEDNQCNSIDYAGYRFTLDDKGYLDIEKIK